MSASPWLRFYGNVPATLDYPSATVYEELTASVRRLPTSVALDFLDATMTYAELGAAVDRFADALTMLGLDRGDRITIATPTAPQGVIAFYAAARVGAVASMIHPLSTETEIEHYLRLSGSRVALTLDVLYDRFARQDLDTLVVTSIADCLPTPKRLAYRATRGRRAPRVPHRAGVHRWPDLVARADRQAAAREVNPDALAAILYSGGTTGQPKGVMLSHRNLTAESAQVARWVGLGERDTVLAVLPIFHGFGLGVLVHTGLTSGARVVLVPQVSPDLVARLLHAKRVTVTAGVPTLFEALARSPVLERADLSSLRAAFCGADALTAEVKDRFEQRVRARGGDLRLLQGYGLTEAVSATVAMPLSEDRPGAVGVPLPDMQVKIYRPGTEEALAPGEDGEICVAGPTVMLGYLDDPAATAATLERHEDGRVWLRTGDVGRMDEDGFLVFVSRLKRIIKSSGFTVYPAQIERVLLAHPAVEAACVVGIPQPARGEYIKAFVVLQNPSAGGAGLGDELIAHCREHLVKWSCPRELEFRSELPLTPLGKVDYRALVDSRPEHGPT
jgi:long-chain acyl-CoA synthetase